MKSLITPWHDLRCRLHGFSPMLAGIVAAGCLTDATAEIVDSELLLLVDVTQSALNDNQFNQLMSGYSAAFSSTEILDSIQSGASGRIAVSLMFFGNTATQQTGIPWMMIGDSSQALQFATLLQNVPRPFATGTADVGSALTAGASSFGTETGGLANGFESAVQIIEVAEARKPPNNSGAATAASSAAALANGVDVINALALGNQASAIDTYYEANVIGSTIQGVAASSNTAPLTSSLSTAIAGMLSESVQTGATISITTVPEPGTIFPLIIGALISLGRRRR